MDISICIPFHLKGRDNTTYQMAFEYYSKLPYLVHLCGSEGDFSQKFCESYLNDTTKYFEVPQGSVTISSGGDDVLRKKFNDSLMTLPQTYWRCLVGSDDIVSEDYFKKLSQFEITGPVMSGVGMSERLIIVDIERKKLAKVKLRYTENFDLLPGVNAFNVQAMNVCNNKPYHLKGCETGAERYFKSVGRLLPLSGSITMLKDRYCLNKFDVVVMRHKQLLLDESDMNEVSKWI